MDAKSESQEDYGSVKAATSLSKRIFGITEELNGIRRCAEEEKSQLESELHFVPGGAKKLTERIKESNAKAKAQKLELQSLISSVGGQEHESIGPETDYSLHSRVLMELDHAKLELSRIKLDMASESDAKAKAEKDIEASKSKERMCSSYIEKLKKVIEDATEEHVLLELARIEAEREFRDIESQRVAEAAQFAYTMNKTKRRIRKLEKETNYAKELEKKLSVTTSDVNALQIEMELIRAMERSFKKEKIMRREEELQARTLLKSAEAELEAAKKELASLKDEGFQFMATMDLVRHELNHITEESLQLKKLEERADSAIKFLNSKLLKTKSKLESALVSDERSKAIISNLWTALQQLQTDVQEAKEETELVNDETTAIRLETEEINLETESTEARLKAAMEELEAIKATEATALASLKTVSERRMRAIAHSSQHCSTITVSEFEYEYLWRRADAAQEVANKKVEAAHTWIEAIEAEEKEISLKADIAQRELRELTAVEERDYDHQGSSENEAKDLDVQLAAERRRNLRGENGVLGESRRYIKKRRSSVTSARRRSSSSITRSSITVQKRKKVITKIMRFLRGRRNGELE